jgi:hypothetical protein
MLPSQHVYVKVKGRAILLNPLLLMLTAARSLLLHVWQDFFMTREWMLDEHWKEQISVNRAFL